MTLKIRGLVRHHLGNPEPTLRGLSFELKAGTLTALLGRSGAGKSTMLRCILGLESFERGEIEVDGVTIRGTEQCTPKERTIAIAAARSKLGFVFQSFELFPHLTALQNCVLAPVETKKLSAADARAKALSLLEELGLSHRADAFPDQLSGGQKQRVAIARALTLTPRVLLYDEPTSALDPSLKSDVIQALKRVDQDGVTQVVVTHDLQLAKEVEHVCVLDHGMVIEEGAPDEVLTAPKHERTKALFGSWA